MNSTFRLSAETGLAALLSAMAGFFVSRSTMFDVASPNGGAAVIGFMLVYMALFVGPALFFHLRRAVIPGNQWRLVFLGVGMLLAAAVVVNQTIELHWNSGNGFEGRFRELYAIPILVLPTVWWLVHAYDEFWSGEPSKT